jgi:hypothetical protein
MNKGFGEEKQSGGGVGLVPALIGVGGLGVIAYFGFQYFDKARSDAATDKAVGNIASTNIDIARRKRNIDMIEQKAVASGVNGNGKISTVNYVTQTKEVIDGLLNTTKDQYGLDKYSVKVSPNGNKVKNALFETPVSAIGKVRQIYSIYTQRNLIDDIQKLDTTNYAYVKALFNAALKQKK